MSFEALALAHNDVPSMTHVQFGVKFANRPRAVARQITRRAIGRWRQLRLHVALARFRVKSPTADAHQRDKRH